MLDRFCRETLSGEKALQKLLGFGFMASYMNCILQLAALYILISRGQPPWHVQWTLRELFPAVYVLLLSMLLTDILV